MTTKFLTGGWMWYAHMVAASLDRPFKKGEFKIMMDAYINGRPHNYVLALLSGEIKE